MNLCSMTQSRLPEVDVRRPREVAQEAENEGDHPEESKERSPFGEMRHGSRPNDPFVDVLMTAGFSWADASQDDGLVLETVLPPPTDVVDPTTGIRTRTEYYLNDKGRRVQIVRKFRTVTRQVKVNKNVTRRKNIAEFGEAKGQTEAIRRNVTYFAADEITLDLSRRTDADDVDDPLNKLSGNKSIVLCRLCGAIGDHWTLKCPKRDTLALPNETALAETPAVASSELPTPASGTTGRYVVPANRPGARVTSSESKDDMPTIRLTNLSEETTESV